MPLVSSDYAQRVAARGVPVYVFNDWMSCGGSADHRAVVLHHTASSSSARPQDDAAYCQHGASDAPLYNVLVDRTGCAWILTRNKSNSSGKVSSVALNEALRGDANLVPAAQRGLKDDTSNNQALFAVCAQNNGTGEWWSEALAYGMAVCAAVALECLGLPAASYTTTHRTLTARKIDTTDGQYGAPSDWHATIGDVMSGGGAPTPEEEDMWMTNTVVLSPGATAQLQVPNGAKTCTLRVLVTRGDKTQGKPGTFVVGNRVTNDGKSTPVWNGQLWINSYQRQDFKIEPTSSGVGVRNAGDCECSVALSGT